MRAELGSRPWVAYVVPFSYPWGQAGSRRVDGVCRSIAATGRDVLVVAMPDEASRPGEAPAVVFRDPDTGGTVRAVARRPHPGDPVRRQWDYHVAGARVALDIIGSASSQRPSHVIVYGTVATPLLQVLRWGKANGIPVILDVVERFSARQFRVGPLSPGYASATVGFSHLAQRADGVIAISRHIEDYYSVRGVRTVRVPPTSNLSHSPVGEPARDGVTFGYFGSPGRKDLLGVVVDAFTRVRHHTGRDDLRLIVAGPGTREAVGRRPAGSLKGVEAFGRLPQQEVAALLGSLHASVLARPPERYAQAGYPTKVVESLSVGTPIVCNLTSDLDEVVLDGVTGWVSTGPTVDEMTAALSRAASTSPGDVRRMRQRAREVAEEHFGVARYVAPLDAFLEATV